MSCSLKGCSFGKVQAKGISEDRDRGRKRRRRSKKIRKSRKFNKKSKRRRSKRRSRRFGFKYLRNDQIINSVFHNYPANLTCDRA